MASGSYCGGVQLTFLLCCPPAHHSAVTCCAGGTRDSESPGAKNQRRQRGEARQNLLSELDDARGGHRKLKMEGLMRSGDTYNAGDFSQLHLDFKASHNAVFIALAEWAHACDCVPVEHHTLPAPNVFYLDGSDGGTTRALLASGFATSQLHVANMFQNTVAALVSPPLSLDASRVVLGRAEDALSEELADTPFAAIYLDGCGGAPGPLKEMVRAVFHAPSRKSSRLALGFTLTQAHPSGLSLADREQVTFATISFNPARTLACQTVSFYDDEGAGLSLADRARIRHDIFESCAHTAKLACQPVSFYDDEGAVIPNRTWSGRWWRQRDGTALAHTTLAMHQACMGCRPTLPNSVPEPSPRGWPVVGLARASDVERGSVRALDLLCRLTSIHGELRQGLRERGLD
jgi:hypothetical protein